MSKCRHKWHAASERLSVCLTCKSVRTLEFGKYYYWYANAPFNWYYKRRVTPQ